MNITYYRHILIVTFSCFIFFIPSINAGSKNLNTNSTPTKTESIYIDARKYSNLNEAVLSNKNNNVTIKISSVTFVTSDLIIPQNISILIYDEGIIKHGSFSLYIKGKLISNSNLIFLGNGLVSFAISSVEKIYPQWFGAKGNGIDDDTSAIQSAVNSVTEGGHVCLPFGKYLISSSIHITNSNVTIDGSHSTLLLNDSSGKKHHLHIGTGVKQIGGVNVIDLIFTRIQAASDGAAIFFNFAGVCTVSNIRIYGDNKIYIGVLIDRGIMVQIFDSYIQGTINAGVKLYGSNNKEMRTVDTRVDRCRIESCNIGIYCGDYVEGLFVRNNIIYNCKIAGIIYGASRGKGLISIMIQQNDIDSCGLGVQIENCSNITIDGNWFSTTGINIDLLHGTNTAILSNNQLYGASANNVQINGKYVRMNGNLLSGGSHGVYVKTGAQDVHLSGNTLSNMTGFGINLFENPASVSVIDNSFYGNGTGTVGDVASPSSRFISNNFGYPSGSSYITVGPSPFSYSSGSTPESISIYGGNISSVSIDGVNISLSNNISFMLPPQKTVVIRYQELPIMAKTRW